MEIPAQPSTNEAEPRRALARHEPSSDRMPTTSTPHSYHNSGSVGSHPGGPQVRIKPDPESHTHSYHPHHNPHLPRPSHDYPSDVQEEPSRDDSGPEVSAHIQKLLADASNSPEVLESAVEVGAGLIDSLAAPLDNAPYPDAAAWLKSLRDLQTRTQAPRTVVGVVGNTGAGKSSVINALLDEERLLPTNCLRACTASPTEISYNHSDDPEALYRAEVEFITAEDWIGELRVLFTDLVDGNGDVSRECNNADSDAGIAYAKLKAVYPNKTKEMLAQGNPHAFAHEPAVRRVLGSVKILNERSASELYQQLQRYVDSKEKERVADPRAKNNVMEFWPLIKVVRIYTKAAALSTGAVIVDLPGVQDSNAARATVAGNYMKSCSGLWIVAPITRAVDDKTAKSLLGDSFKRQLKYDGTYSAVTFICSKTDDISVTEAAESLNMEEEISESWRHAEHLGDIKDDLKGQLAALKEAKATCKKSLEDCEASYDTWDELESQFEDGKTVYAPSSVSKKRKRPEKAFSSRKKGTFDFDEDSDYSVSEDESDKENSQPSFEDRVPLTEDIITQTLLSLKAERKSIREERRGLDAKMSELRARISQVNAEREELLAEVTCVCIKGRNHYSRAAIKQDFAMGIKELDQENAIEESDETFNPDQDLRDYDQVATSLPVFCVSSRAYQRLSGKLRKDNFQSQGYMTAEDTEIPQLQEHAKKLTEASRMSNARQFLNDLGQLLNSMKLWSTGNGKSALTDTEKAQKAKHIHGLLRQLDTDLDSTVGKSIVDVQLALHRHIYESFNQSIPLAISSAVDTAAGWGAHRSMGGLFWATYKATVRRYGVYCGASGPRDFNAELFEPISRHLATHWERAFQRGLPAILTEFAAECRRLLTEFHDAAINRSGVHHANVVGVNMLLGQMAAHCRTVDDIPNKINAIVIEIQREASREFTPVICEAMTSAYDICTAERGAGSYVRMKQAMVSHVETARKTMFRQAADTVEGRLLDMCETMRVHMRQKTSDICALMHRDYMAALVGAHNPSVPQSRMVISELDHIKQDVRAVLVRAATVFSMDDGAGDNDFAEGQEEDLIQAGLLDELNNEDRLDDHGVDPAEEDEFAGFPGPCDDDNFDQQDDQQQLELPMLKKDNPLQAGAGPHGFTRGLNTAQQPQNRFSTPPFDSEDEFPTVEMILARDVKPEPSH